MHTPRECWLRKPGKIITAPSSVLVQREGRSPLTGRDPVNGHFDSLAGDTSIRIFGRLMWDIVLREANTPDPKDSRNRVYDDSTGSGILPPRMSKNNFLLEQLKDPEARLARIMAFSYQNQMFDLARPAIFVVHGVGTLVEFVSQVAGNNRFLRRMPTFTERSGMVGQSGSFSPEVKMWLYDRADFTVRLDTDAGTFESLLLDYELGGGLPSGSMQAGDGDDPPRPRGPRGRRRWRGSSD